MPSYAKGSFINMSGSAIGPVLLTDGTAAAPALTFTADGSDDGLYRIGTDNLGIALGGAIEWNLTTTAFSPGASNGSALGTTSLMWSDLFLASGAVINFNNGDVTLTHSANTLAFAGASSGYTHDAPVIVTNGARMSPVTNTTAPLGSELIVNGTFDSDLTGWTAGANWSWDATGKALHAAGSVETLAQNISVTNGQTYQVTITTSGRTAGSITVTLGAVTLDVGSGVTAIVTNAAFIKSMVAGATGSVAYAITPTTGWDGMVDAISVKQITAVSDPAFYAYTSAGAAFLEVRGSNTLNNLGAGLSALRYVTTGTYNSAFGLQALYSNTTGANNSAFGEASLYTNSTGANNSAFGRNSLYLNTTGADNSAFGLHVLYSNTTGANNSAFGLQALYSNTTGANNSAFGRNSLYSNTTGADNSAFGLQALYSNTTGASNSAFGLHAGRYITGGSVANATSGTSVYLGAETKASADGNANEIVIGYNTTGAGSNSATLGNASITSTILRGTVTFGGHLLVSADNTYDIGASGATRPRAIYVGTTGINNAGPMTQTGLLTASGDSIVIATAQSPASGAAGTAGEIAWDASYIYVCTATGVWKRVALTGAY